MTDSDGEVLEDALLDDLQSAARNGAREAGRMRADGGHPVTCPHESEPIAAPAHALATVFFGTAAVLMANSPSLALLAAGGAALASGLCLSEVL